ncbi:MAG: NAD+ synthase [Cyanobacteriota bacterium]|jgi:NAD+ synthase (glutamine-hydrolysing)
MRIALAQLDPVVGDLEGNGERVLAACEAAVRQDARLVLTPELSLWGYPPRDLLLRGSCLERQQGVLDRLAAAMPEGLAVLVGMAEPIAGGGQPALYNSLALVERQGWRSVCRKRLLPSYDVFDERRYFRAGEAPAVLELEGDGRIWRLGLTICEDLWVEEDLQGHRLAGADPIAELLPHQVDLLINLSASPFGQGKAALRRRLAARAAARLSVPVLYVNQVGGNDELVFDGGSFLVDAAGGVVRQLACAATDLVVWDGTADLPATAPLLPPPGEEEQLLRVLVLGVRDYARKCGFERVLLGLSGGIDSALVAVIACAALTAEGVRALLMPSPWSSAGSIDDATALAERLGLATATVPIAGLMEAFDDALTPVLGGEPEGLTAENLQSRIRGNLLMAVANQEGRLLLTTGNKSELAVGYCTLYGDMNGGLAVIGDLYKTSVFRLCAWIDSPASASCRADLGLPASGALIGEAIRQKAPSAELRPEQRDSDSLPPYELLDPLLKELVERLAPPEELVEAGQDPSLVARVMGLLRRAEFKRRQAAPALKVSGRAFGSGWRMPIAAKVD